MESGKYLKSISATIEQIPDTVRTRANVLIVDKKFKTYWEAGDELGIYPVGGDQVKFPISSIDDSNPGYAYFDGGSWALRSQYSYAAYYPYEASNYVVPQTQIPFSYEGQTVNALNDFTHMGDYAFMAAAAQQPNSNGGVNLEFKHIGCFVRLDLTFKETTTLKSIKLSCADALFIVNGTCDLTNSGDPYLTPTSGGALHEYTLGVNNVDVTANQVALFWLMLHPVDLSGKTLKITATNTKDEEYEGTVDGKKMVRLGASNYVVTMTKKPDPRDYEEFDAPYVTFHADEAQTLKMTKEVPTLQYSVDGGTWADLGTTEVNFGGALGELRLRGKSPYGTARTNYEGGDYSSIEFSTNASVSASGDIRTLVNYTNYEAADCSNARFTRLFFACYPLTQAPQLPITSLADYCYEAMFANCTALTTAPDLPATTLSKECYGGMFSGCSSLTKAPELLAPSLVVTCYQGMFSSCSNLNYIKMLATDTSADYCLEGWTEGVAPSGTFIKLPNATLPTGTSGIPTGWNVVDYSGVQIGVNSWNSDGKDYGGTLI